jgi:CRISPR-associated protein Csb2
MSLHLVLSFRFLAPWFHGRGDDEAPEWPPSPLRAYQALVAAAARGGTLSVSQEAFESLEALPAPVVIASEATVSTVGYLLSVPNNAMDIVGRQWVAGREGDVSKHRAMKDVRPHRLPEHTAVHYAWPLTDGYNDSHTKVLIAAARNVVALGWGVDLVVGDGAVVDGAQLAELAVPSTMTWAPRNDGRTRLRAPLWGTLDDLSRRHDAFLKRTSLADPTLRPAPALSTFAITRYARGDQEAAPELGAFILMHPEADRMRAFETARRGMAVAGMLRHAVRAAAARAGWPAERVNGTVLGHGETGEPRLLLVPVPSIEPRGPGAETVGAIRRVLVFSTESQSPDVAWIRRALGGAELIDEKEQRPTAVLAMASENDRIFRRFLDPARSWATVTPIVLPGLDDPGGVRERLRRVRSADEQRQLLDRIARRREGLVRKALRHAGFSDDLAFGATIETRETGYLAGVDLASRYAVPRHLSTFPRLHARITWEHSVNGPLCIGRGRFSGLGLLASLEG